jgi:hypothetical protein
LETKHDQIFYLHNEKLRIQSILICLVCNKFRCCITCKSNFWHLDGFCNLHNIPRVGFSANSVLQSNSRCKSWGPTIGNVKRTAVCRILSRWSHTAQLTKTGKEDTLNFKAILIAGRFQVGLGECKEVSGTVTMIPEAFSDLILSPGSPMYSGFSFSFTEYNM